MKDGDVPRAYSPAFESVIAEYGLHMAEMKGRNLVSEDSKQLCRQLLQAEHDAPLHTSYPLTEFLSVWDQIRTRNESKIFRDLTPLLMPSPELLFACGLAEVEHVKDELSVEWTKSKTMGGPKPKPDSATGIAGSAFGVEEIAKLQNYTAFGRPTMFTDQIYFPFLLCEAKCGNEGLDRADRQNMHSSSIAVDAIVQLYRALGSEREAELSGEILVFSISHNHDSVKMYGHFAILHGGRASYYRYHITTFVLGLEEGGWKRVYDYTRELYRFFYPQYLKRLQHALAEMKMPSRVSISQAIDAAAALAGAEESMTSSQDIAFMVPDAPASKRHKGVLALLREQLAKQEQQNKKQATKQEQQHKEQTAKQEQQIAKQEQQHKEQAALQEQQHKEQTVKQEQQMAKQEQQHKEQMIKQEQQYKEQMSLLKQLLHGQKT